MRIDLIEFYGKMSSESYTENYEYIAGVIAAHSNYCDGVFAENEKMLRSYLVEKCELDADSKPDVLQKEDIIRYLAENETLEWNDEIRRFQVRASNEASPIGSFICAITYPEVFSEQSGKHDKTVCDIYRFTNPDFLEGITDAARNLRVHISRSTVLKVDEASI